MVGRRRAGRMGGRAAYTARRASTVTSRLGDTLYFRWNIVPTEMRKVNFGSEALSNAEDHLLFIYY